MAAWKRQEEASDAKATDGANAEVKKPAAKAKEAPQSDKKIDAAPAKAATSADAQKPAKPRAKKLTDAKPEAPKKVSLPKVGGVIDLRGAPAASAPKASKTKASESSSGKPASKENKPAEAKPAAPAKKVCNKKR